MITRNCVVGGGTDSDPTNVDTFLSARQIRPSMFTESRLEAPA